MDYDVEARRLAVPANPSPLDTYRPAIEVRNNGIFPAVATGTIQIYTAGLLIFSSNVTSPTIQPGATANAIAADLWTPEAEGDFVIFGQVSTYRDQNEQNGHLAPVTISISGTPPTPPPVVPAHAAQHEDGGSDPIDVNGLPGQLRDEQLAAPHAATHQAGNPDELNLSGLPGVLAEPQVPTDHGNEHHNPDMATASALTTHQNATSVHTAATNLANRETTGPDAGLVPGAQLAAGTELPDAGDDPDKAGLRLGRDWGPTNAVHHGAKHARGGLDPVDMSSVISDVQINKLCTPAGGQVTLTTAELQSNQAHPGTVCKLSSVGTVATATGANQAVKFTLFCQSDFGTTEIVNNTYNLAGNKSYTYHLDGMIGYASNSKIAATLEGEVTDVGAPGTEIHADKGADGTFTAPATTHRFFLTAEWVNGQPASSMNASNTLLMGVSLL